MSVAPLSEWAYNPLLRWTKSCTDIPPYSLISSCVANIPETKALLELKRGGRARFPYTVCLIEKKRLHELTLFPKIKMDRTIAMMDTSVTGFLTKNKIGVRFAESSMHPVASFLSKIPFCRYPLVCWCKLDIQVSSIALPLTRSWKNVKWMYISDAWRRE